MALGTAVMGKHTEIVKDLAPDPEDTAYRLFFVVACADKQ